MSVEVCDREHARPSPLHWFQQSLRPDTLELKTDIMPKRTPYDQQGSV